MLRFSELLLLYGCLVKAGRHIMTTALADGPVHCAAALWFGESNLVEWTPANTPWLIE